MGLTRQAAPVRRAGVAVARSLPAAAPLLAVLCALGACTFNLGGSSTAQEPKKETRSAAFQRNENLGRELIAGISTEGGINYSDASKIANYYLSHHADNRGVLMALAEADRYWEGRILSRGSGVVLDAPLRVDKVTGGVTWGLGPTVRNLQELLSR